MKRIIVILAMAAALTGCGSLSKFKERKEHVQAEKADSTVSTLTVVREKADTVVKVPAVKQNGAKPVQNIIQGDSLVIDNERQRVVVDYDLKTGNLRATAEVKEVDIPIIVDRETIHAEQVKVETEKTDAEKYETVEKEVKTSSGFMNGTFMGVGLALLMMVAGWLLYRYWKL